MTVPKANSRAFLHKFGFLGGERRRSLLKLRKARLVPQSTIILKVRNAFVCRNICQLLVSEKQVFLVIFLEFVSEHNRR